MLIIILIVFICVFSVSEIIFTFLFDSFILDSSISIQFFFSLSFSKM